MKNVDAGGNIGLSATDTPLLVAAAGATVDGNHTTIGGSFAGQRPRLRP